MSHSHRHIGSRASSASCHLIHGHRHAHLFLSVFFLVSLYFFLKFLFHLFLIPAMVPDENSMEDPLCNSSFGRMVSLDYVTPDTRSQTEENPRKHFPRRHSHPSVCRPFRRRLRARVAPTASVFHLRMHSRIACFKTQRLLRSCSASMASGDDGHEHLVLGIAEEPRCRSLESTRVPQKMWRTTKRRRANPARRRRGPMSPRGRPSPRPEKT